MALFFIGVVGFLISLVVLIIFVLKKRSRRAPGIATIFFLVLGVMGMIMAMHTPSVEVVSGSYDKVMSGELNGQVVELVGDVQTILSVADNLVLIDMQLSDGVISLFAATDIPGGLPKEGDEDVKVYIMADDAPDETLVIKAISFPKE